MNTMQKSMFIDALVTRKDNLKQSVEDAKKQSKDLNIFQTYQKGMIDGAAMAVEEEIKCLETYLAYLQECKTEELQKTLH